MNKPRKWQSSHPPHRQHFLAIWPGAGQGKRAGTSIMATLLLTAGLMACERTEYNGPTYKVKGHILNATSPVIINALGVESFCTVTAKDGSFMVAGLKPGNYMLRPNQAHAWFKPSVVPITITDSSIEKIGFKLFSERGSGGLGDIGNPEDYLKDWPAEKPIEPGAGS